MGILQSTETEEETTYPETPIELSNRHMSEINKLTTSIMQKYPYNKKARHILYEKRYKQMVSRHLYEIMIFPNKNNLRIGTHVKTNTMNRGVVSKFIHQDGTIFVEPIDASHNGAFYTQDEVTKINYTPQSPTRSQSPTQSPPDSFTNAYLNVK